VSMAVVLIGQSIGERTFTKFRKIVVIVGVMALAAIFLPHGIHNLPHDSEEIARQFESSRTWRIVLAPLSVFARILTADPLFPDVIKFAAIAFAMLAVLLMIV